VSTWPLSATSTTAPITSAPLPCNSATTASSASRCHVRQHELHALARAEPRELAAEALPAPVITATFPFRSFMRSASPVACPSWRP